MGKTKNKWFRGGQRTKNRWVRGGQRTYGLGGRQRTDGLGEDKENMVLGEDKKQMAEGRIRLVQNVKDRRRMRNKGTGCKKGPDIR